MNIYKKYDRSYWHMKPEVELLYQRMINAETVRDTLKLRLSAINAQHDELAQRFTMKRLVELKSMDYKDYLRTPEWQERRDKALHQANGRCQRCGNYRDLQVHHKTYERKGEELPQDLIVLCRDCHEKEHGLAVNL